jgi:hypothetical protein
MTWQLVSQSFRLLRDDLKLIVFPILSAAGAIALSLPYLLMIFKGRLWGDIDWGPNAWLLAFAWYACASFVTIFFNCALTACMQMRFAGQTPTIAGGLKRAAARVHTILLWSLLTSTVGRLLEMLEQKVGFIARIAIALVGLSWNMATFLIVPVLVMEDRGVIDSMRRSALVRQTWGEQLISVIWFGWMELLVVIPGVVLGALGANGYPIFIVPTVLWFAGWLAAFTAAREIFTVVLYRYAMTGEPPAGFDTDSLRAALRR